MTFPAFDSIDSFQKSGMEIDDRALSGCSKGMR
jgi:hypothetical protein